MFQRLLPWVLIFVAIHSQAEAIHTHKQRVKSEERSVKKPTANSSSAGVFSPIFWSGLDDGLQKYLQNYPHEVFQWIGERQSEIKKLLPQKPDAFSTNEDRDKYINAVKSSAPDIPAIPMLIDCSKRYHSEQQEFSIEIDVGLRLSGYEDVDSYQTVENMRSLNLRRISALDYMAPKDNRGIVIKEPSGASGNLQTYQRHFALLVPFGAAYEPANIFEAKYPQDKNLNAYGTYKIRFAMESATARLANANIICMGIFTPIWPALAARQSITSIRLASGGRRNVYENEFGIIATLDQLLVANSTSGEVYWRAARN